jgi:PAS domain S-box-containing protein
MSEKTKSVTDLRALGSWILTRLRTIKWKQFIFGYGLAVASAALTVGLVLLLRHYSLRISLTLLVVAALIGTTWYGGLGPGLVLSVLLEIATVALTTAPPRGAGAIFTQFSGFGLLVILVILVYTQKRAQMRWRESAEWLRVTLSSIGDAVIATDLNGVVTFMNPVAEALTGWAISDAANKPLREVFQTSGEQSLSPDSTPGPDTGISGPATGSYLISKDGVRTPIDDSGAPIRDEKGGVAGAVLVFRDVTDRRQVEQERERLLERERQARSQAETASRIKDEFLATLSHELRTPLTAVLGWSKLLKGGTLDEENTQMAIDAIERSAKVQTQIVNDLLDMSRIISGKMRLEVRPIELGPILEAAIETLRPAAEAKGIILRTVVQPPFIQINGDPDRLQQVMWNLLSNAIRFTPRDGCVEVKARRAGLDVEIKVIDAGIGIKKEFLPFVFDRFRQADSSLTRTYGGLGLGLAIVRNLVELHGGSVQADSPGEGKGATFAVLLPAAEAGQFQHAASVAGSDIRSSASKDESSDERIDLQGLRILVVDDEEDALELISVILCQHGAEVRTVNSARAALDVLPSWRPNVLLSDIGMPDEDGYGFIRKVRSLSPELGGKTPAAALTAFARTEDRLLALAAGYQIHVSKPVDPIILAQVVSGLAGKSEG